MAWDEFRDWRLTRLLTRAEAVRLGRPRLPGVCMCANDASDALIGFSYRSEFAGVRTAARASAGYIGLPVLGLAACFELGSLGAQAGSLWHGGALCFFYFAAEGFYRFSEVLFDLVDEVAEVDYDLFLFKHRVVEQIVHDAFRFADFMEGIIGGVDRF